MGMAVAVQPAATGALGAVKTFDAAAHAARLRQQYVRDDAHGHYRRERERLLLHRMDAAHRRGYWQQKALAWLRDHVHRSIPTWWYKLVLGHDAHVVTFAWLHVQHYHATEPDPFTGRLGWLENVGLVCERKVTTAFRDFEVDQLIAESSAYGDYKFHRPGTSATAEANSQTGLVADAGLEATGTQVEAAADQYQSVATVTADTSETWQEHSIRNATGAAGGTMMDRNLISPTVAVVASDQVTFTFTLTKTAEA
jgi:hypothetical protein